jgi:bifunctional DNase/RNase
MPIEVRVKALAFDPSAGTFVMLLSDLEQRYALPIWIGPFEANAIAMKLSNTSLHRPMTYDLIGNIMKTFDAEILKIEVMDLKDDTYYAMIHMLADGRELTVDSRPSDAIAVALTAGAPIYVRERVFYKAKTVPLAKGMDEDQLKEFLESLNPEDFKYKA